MELEFLADNPEAIPVLARWYFDEWGHIGKGRTLGEFTEGLHAYLNTDEIPLIVLAVEGTEVLGAAQLKYREMAIYPEKEHWLGGVYVARQHRGKRVAEKIVNKTISVADKLGVEKLYLQTENPSGGLYSRLGWQPLERVCYRGIDVLVMQRQI